MPRARIAYNSFVTNIERRSKLIRSWKNAAGEAQSENADLGWFISIDFSGLDFTFFFGDEMPIHLVKGSPISVILEYQVPDDSK